jgi:ubiquinone biosynthesis protein
MVGRKLHRSREIARVLVRHGLGYVAMIVGLERFVPFHARLSQREDRSQAGAARLRAALEDLGATFIKLGQILSTRADLFPPPYQDELSKLQDHAPPAPSDEIAAAILEDLGASPAELFAAFSAEQLAVASIGQVHAATRHDGVAVVVKVRRPGVVDSIEGDLALLHDLAAVAGRRPRSSCAR